MYKSFFLIVGTIFLMELGDKTQLAAISFASKYRPMLVYLAVVLGMALCTVVSVAIGKTAATFIPVKYIKIFVGLLFVAVGIWTLLSK